AVALVEAACTLVALKGPQPESDRPLELRPVQKGRSHAAVLCVRMHVQVADQIVLESDEADHPVLGLGDPDVVAPNHDRSKPGARLAVRVECWKKRQPSKGGDEDLRDRVDVVLARWSDEHAA